MTDSDSFSMKDMTKYLFEVCNGKSYFVNLFGNKVN